MKKIIIASNNKAKIREIRAIIGEQDIELLDLKDIGFTDEITEDGYSIKENAVKKGLSVMKAVGELTIADDSGLEVDAIDGQPGVLSARFSGEGATDESNNRKLLELLSNIPMEKRGAQFRCVMALIYPNGRILTAEGICRGRIAYKPIGDKGFGYDPIFIPNGYDKTFSQLGSHVKNQISHRAIALYKMKGIMIREGLIV